MAHVVKGSVHGADEYGEDLVVVVLDPGEAKALTEALRFCAVDGDLPVGLSGLAEAMYEAVGGAS